MFHGICESGCGAAMSGHRGVDNVIYVPRCRVTMPDTRSKSLRFISADSSNCVLDTKPMEVIFGCNSHHYCRANVETAC